MVLTGRPESFCLVKTICRSRNRGVDAFIQPTKMIFLSYTDVQKSGVSLFKIEPILFLNFLLFLKIELSII